MNIDKYFEPDFDFSQIDQEELKWMGDVTTDEIVYAFKNRRSVCYDQAGYPPVYNRWFCVGFSYLSRCFDMLVTINDRSEVTFLIINLTDEYGIERFWCRKGPIL